MKQAEDPVCFTERQNKRNIKELTIFCKKIYLIIIVTISILFFLLYRTKKFQIYQKTLKRGYFDMEKLIYKQTTAAIKELCEKAKMKEGNTVVIGCSTSEVVGSVIGTNSNFEIAGEIFKALYDYTKSKGVFLAVQCCEHLNRAIVTEQKAAPFSESVNVVPQPKAGGSLATHAYRSFDNPVVLEEIKADAGLDIGLTLIGMHLKKVAVPLRLENNKIGEAPVVAARTRPKFIGGERAVYNEEIL